MFLSCKVSNSVMTFIESRGADWAAVFDQIKSSPDLLRDPSYWIEAGELETLLRVLAENFRGHQSAEEWIYEVGVKEYEVRSWGVLDQVLRIMARPQEILAQPERFLAYFISPQPPILNVEKSATHVGFDLPLMPEEWPLIACYLRGALASLPTFASHSPAQVKWQGVRIEVEWTADTNALFSVEDAGRQLSPELTRNLISSLENSQKELEEKNRTLLTQNEALRKKRKLRPDTDFGQLYSQMLHMRDLGLEFEVPAERALQSFQKLHDYFVRSHQLITLLVGPNRLKPEVQEAMRRVDWDTVVSSYGDLVSGSVK
ncbi:MAG: hypothetical protein AB7H97_07565 [Pseudobdellovibrionaceae bacterium]